MVNRLVGSWVTGWMLQPVDKVDSGGGRVGGGWGGIDAARYTRCAGGAVRAGRWGS